MGVVNGQMGGEAHQHEYERLRSDERDAFESTETSTDEDMREVRHTRHRRSSTSSSYRFLRSTRNRNALLNQHETFPDTICLNRPAIASTRSSARYPSRTVSFLAAFDRLEHATNETLDYFEPFELEFKLEMKATDAYAHRSVINDIWRNKVLRDNKYNGKPKTGSKKKVRGNGAGEAEALSFRKRAGHLHTFNHLQLNMERALVEFLESQLLPPRSRDCVEIDLGDGDDYADPHDSHELEEYHKARALSRRVHRSGHDILDLLAAAGNSHASMKLLLVELDHLAMILEVYRPSEWDDLEDVDKFRRVRDRRSKFKLRAEADRVANRQDKKRPAHSPQDNYKKNDDARSPENAYHERDPFVS